MSMWGFLLLLLVAAVAGGIGQALAGYSRGGCLASIFFGLIGAYIGLWLAGQFNLPEFFVINIDGQPYPLIWSILGAAVTAGIFSLLFGRRRVYRT
jgi:uncharacterized membrane protein YeaQ/YmgE (transglycosylase-associated protein family)